MFQWSYIWYVCFSRHTPDINHTLLTTWVYLGKWLQILGTWLLHTIHDKDLWSVNDTLPSANVYLIWTVGIFIQLGHSALFCASDKGHVDVVQLLLQKHADVGMVCVWLLLWQWLFACWSLYALYSQWCSSYDYMHSGCAEPQRIINRTLSAYVYMYIT